MRSMKSGSIVLASNPAQRNTATVLQWEKIRVSPAPPPQACGRAGNSKVPQNNSNRKKKERRRCARTVPFLLSASHEDMPPLSSYHRADVRSSKKKTNMMAPMECERRRESLSKQCENSGDQPNSFHSLGGVRHCVTFVHPTKGSDMPTPGEPCLTTGADRKCCTPSLL